MYNLHHYVTHCLLHCHQHLLSHALIGRCMACHLSNNPLPATDYQRSFPNPMSMWVGNMFPSRKNLVDVARALWFHRSSCLTTFPSFTCAPTQHPNPLKCATPMECTHFLGLNEGHSNRLCLPTPSLRCGHQVTYHHKIIANVGQIFLEFVWQWQRHFTAWHYLPRTTSKKNGMAFLFFCANRRHIHGYQIAHSQRHALTSYTPWLVLNCTTFYASSPIKTCPFANGCFSPQGRQWTPRQSHGP